LERREERERVHVEKAMDGTCLAHATSIKHQVLYSIYLAFEQVWFIFVSLVKISSHWRYFLLGYMLFSVEIGFEGFKQKVEG
jgi:hypothetical protein